MAYSTTVASLGPTLQPLGLWPEALSLSSNPFLGISIPVSNPRDPTYVVAPGQGYDGVALILLTDGDNCTGSLLTSGQHVLTAAHCFEAVSQDGQPTLEPELDDVTVVFRLPTGELRLDPIHIDIHPEWSDLDGFNGDLAIIHLSESLPPEVPRYELYRNSDEVGQVFTRLGYGVMATGAKGEFGEDDSTVLRQGKNRYEALGELYNEADGDLESYIQPGTQLIYDYDSGQPKNDALGIEYGLTDLGLGSLEIGSSGGDSGGPAFLDGRVAGISSSGSSPDQDGIDVTWENDTSFGEYFFDTRVSAYADYIDQVMSGGARLAQLQGEERIAASGREQAEDMNGLSGELLSLPVVLILGMTLGSWAVVKARSRHREG